MFEDSEVTQTMVTGTVYLPTSHWHCITSGKSGPDQIFSSSHLFLLLSRPLSCLIPSASFELQSRRTHRSRAACFVARFFRPQHSIPLAFVEHGRCPINQERTANEASPKSRIALKGGWGVLSKVSSCYFSIAPPLSNLSQSDFIIFQFSPHLHLRAPVIPTPPSGY